MLVHLARGGLDLLERRLEPRVEVGDPLVVVPRPHRELVAELADLDRLERFVLRAQVLEQHVHSIHDFEQLGVKAVALLERIVL